MPPAELREVPRIQANSGPDQQRERCGEASAAAGAASRSPEFVAGASESMPERKVSATMAMAPSQQGASAVVRARISFPTSSYGSVTSTKAQRPKPP